MKNIIIKESTIEEVIKVHRKITEFYSHNEPKEYFTGRYGNKKKLIIVAYLNNSPAGYLIGYDKSNDGSFYCWIVGVDPKYRQMGILKKLMDYLIKWAKKQGYKKIKLSTWNSFRAMLSYLVKYNFMFVKVIPGKTIENNQIKLEKDI